MKPSSASRSANGNKGAVQRKTGLKARSGSYWGHHRYSLFNSYSRLLATPGQTLMTSLVVAVALALPMILLVTIENVDRLGKSWDANPKISAYINPRAQEAAIQQLTEEIGALTDVQAVQYISPEQALIDFQQVSGFGSALDALEQNPLPPTIIISPKTDAVASERLENLQRRIEAYAIVDEASVDLEWVSRLQEIMLLGKKAVLALASLLALGVLLAIGNTIRLTIESRRDEILVTKLVGGTDGFVRRPFLYAGAWYGLFGGLLAWLLVSAGYGAISPSVSRLAAAYQSGYQLEGLGLIEVLQVIFVSVFIGLAGAWLAVGRHLRNIEPS